MEKKLRATLKQGSFKNVPTRTSKIMGLVRSRGNRSTELRFRSRLVRNGLTGWLVQPNMIGNPDFFFPLEKVAVFLDGCFWHGCASCGHIPRTNSSFWKLKIKLNKARDKNKTRLLHSQGVYVIRFWEHEIKNDMNPCINRLQRILSGTPGSKRDRRTASLQASIRSIPR